MNKNELITEMAKKAGLTKVDAGRALDSFIKVVEVALTKGGDVRLVGFGTFSVAQRKSYEGRNPRSGQKIKIPSSKRPKFRAGKGLKDAVNKR